jgi:hypothetical protein
MSKNFSIRLTSDGNLVAEAICEVTGKPYSVKVSYSGYKRWKGNVLIQDALPELNGDQREFLMSHMTPAEYDKMCKDVEVAEKEESHYEPCSCCGGEAGNCDCGHGCSYCSEDLL